MSLRVRWFLSASLATACGGDPAGVDAGPLPDAGDPDVALLLAVSGDFAATGILSTVGVPSGTVTADVSSGVAGSDPVLRGSGNALFIVNRLGGNNVTQIAESDLSLVEQHATGADSNPQDAALLGTTLYVPALGTAGVVEILADGTTRVIDLSSLDPADGKPNCNSILEFGGDLLVTCGLLDDTDEFLTPRGPGVAVLLDPSGAIVDQVTLPANNPVGWLKPDGFGSALVGLVPSYQDFSTGCLARIRRAPDLVADCLVSNDALGGYANRYDHLGDRLWIAVNGFDDQFNGFGRLVGFDLDAEVLDASPTSPATQVITDLAICQGGRIAVSDRPLEGPNGIRLYGADGVEQTTAPLPIGLPPNFGNGLHCLAR